MGLNNVMVRILLWSMIAGILLPGLCAGERLTITADMQYEYAFACGQEADDETAMVEWKRFIHFFPSDPRVPDARFYLGIALFHLKKWDQAQAIFQAQRFPYVGSSRNIESFFMLSKTLLSQGRPGGAERVLRDLLDESDAVDVRDRALSALAWIYLDRAGNMEPGALERAEAFLSEISTTGETVFHGREIRQAIDTILHQESKSPWVAGTAAALVPGAGFAYCERYRDALAALVINAGLIFAAHDSFEDGNNVLGGLICAVASGFYGGNIYGAISSAHKYNRRKTRQGLNAIRHLDSRHFPTVPLENSSVMHPTPKMFFSLQIPF